jgi:capsular polysaccharide biosynthesis protein
MTNRFFGRRLLRLLWIPIVLPLVAAGSMATLDRNAPHDYKATATVIAKNPPSGLEKTLNFADIVTSNTVALRVKKQLGLKDSVDQLVAKIQVSQGRSNLYGITVTDSDPARATKIANAVAKESGVLYTQLGSGSGSSVLTELDKQRAGYQQRYRDAALELSGFDAAHPGLMKDADTKGVDPTLATQRKQLVLNEQAAAAAYLKFEDQAAQGRITSLASQRDFEAFVVDEAVAKPDPTRSLLRIAYAGGLGFLLGLAIVFLVQLRRPPVRAADQVEEMLGIPVIATVPRATRRTLKTPRAS